MSQQKTLKQTTVKQTSVKQTTGQLVKFIVMGSLAALVHLAVLYLAVTFFYITPAWANAIAFIVAFVVSFIGHLNVTFKDNHLAHKARVSSRLTKWFISALSGFILNQGLFVLGLAWLGESYYLLIWFIVTGIVTALSFLLGKLWAFK